MGKVKQWTKEDESWLINNYGTVNFGEILIKLGRTKKSVGVKLSRLGVTKRFWTKEKEGVLIDNYHLGRVHCANLLNITPTQVSTKVRHLGLFVRNVVDIDEYKSEVGSYILGLLWADGYVNKINNYIALTVTKEDGLNLKDLFLNLGDNWKIYENDRTKYKGKNSITIGLTSPELSEFLKRMDYANKSTVGADKILEFLPKNSHPHFFRGLIDGDGCFYFNSRNSCRQFTIASSYDQDWGYLERWLVGLGVKYTVNRYKKRNKNTGKINAYSTVRVLGGEILKLGLIYDQYDNIGLKRKYDKFIEIEESYDNKSL